MLKIFKLKMKYIYLFFLIILSPNYKCFSQNYSTELWPEVDIWYRLNSSWRFSSFASLTKYNESDNTDANLSLSADYAWGKTKLMLFRKFVNDEEKLRMNAFMVRLGVMQGRSINNDTDDYIEKMIYSEIHKRIPLKSSILLSHRLRMDNRWIGNESDYSYRFRYRFMIEKEFKKGNTSIVPYFNIEPFWDSRYTEFTRVRSAAGASVSMGAKFALESNLTYQHDNTYTTENLYAINLILHIFIKPNK
jgi:hypothetical protein